MKFGVIFILLLCLLNSPGFSGLAKPLSGFELIVFEGSDWCTYCFKFNQRVLSDTLFSDYLLQNDIVVVKVDFPQQKKQTYDEEKKNSQIAERYNFKGEFPTIIITSKSGSDFRKISYNTNLSIEGLMNQMDAYIQSSKL